MDTDLHLWFFIFYNKEYIFDVLGGQGWSRTTVLGFSVRHTDRVCHPPILASFSSHKTLILCKLLDSNQSPIVYQTIALPCELNSLQVVSLLDVSLWLREVRFELTISSFLFFFRLIKKCTFLL